MLPNRKHLQEWKSSQGESLMHRAKTSQAGEGLSYSLTSSASAEKVVMANFPKLLPVSEIM